MNGKGGEERTSRKDPFSLNIKAWILGPSLPANEGDVTLWWTNILPWKDPPCYSWENPRFLWPFSIAMLVITRGSYNGYITIIIMVIINGYRMMNPSRWRWCMVMLWQNLRQFWFGPSGTWWFPWVVLAAASRRRATCKDPSPSSRYWVPWWRPGRAGSCEPRDLGSFWRFQWMSYGAVHFQHLQYMDDPQVTMISWRKLSH